MKAQFRNSTALPKAALKRGLNTLQAFGREEDGVLAKPTIFFFLAMLAIGGAGVDLMRMERDRTVLQYTLDRAVLAAADLDQPLTPDAVVLDYLTKAGLGEYYEAPWSDTGLGYRKVEASIDTEFPAHMLKFAGGSDLPLFAKSRAEESIDGLEISMVLDVSGSMNSNSRLTNLKVAAQEFVDTMVANTTDGKMSISIIPYATQVSMPQAMFDEYNIDTPNTFSRCVNFRSSDFSTTSMSTTSQHEGSMHFTPWDSSSRDNRTRYSTPRLIDTPVCEDDSRREMLLFQKDANTLKTFIQNLWGGGNTSIDIGMKWGTALLDPSARPAVSTLSGGIVDSDFAARPSEYTDPDTLKIVVLMTDGQNTSQYYVESDHRHGNSGVWYDAGTRGYSTYDASYNDYYSHYRDRWYSQPYGDNPQRLTWNNLFAYTSLRYLYRSIYDDWMSSSSAKNTYYYGIYDYYGNSTKNARTRSICQAAKDQGIIVYTIGFEAPSDGVAVLQDCASSDAHYFDVDGLEISDAFASIATSIRQLRLTQ